MALVKGLSRIDEQGKIGIPKSIRKRIGLKEGQLVQIKVQGTKPSHWITIKAHQKAL